MESNSASNVESNKNLDETEPSAWAEEDRNRRIDIILIYVTEQSADVTRVSCDLNFNSRVT